MVFSHFFHGVEGTTLRSADNVIAWNKEICMLILANKLAEPRITLDFFPFIYSRSVVQSLRRLVGKGYECQDLKVDAFLYIPSDEFGTLVWPFGPILFCAN